MRSAKILLPVRRKGADPVTKQGANTQHVSNALTPLHSERKKTRKQANLKYNPKVQLINSQTIIDSSPLSEPQLPEVSEDLLCEPRYLRLNVLVHVLVRSLMGKEGTVKGKMIRRMVPMG